ncbi:MAG TPA: type II toxin-antitoxin system HicB family antitoxin [Candidatus Dormibacteraeota bacterium]|nr:type II toxin-antitoxin system HicB family antitoxin [Candidatus Dormibacteraeota bacterium]
MKLNAIVTRVDGEDLYVAQAVEVDVASQGATADEAVRNLQEALELYFDEDEAPPRPHALADVELRQVDIPLAS